MYLTADPTDSSNIRLLFTELFGKYRVREPRGLHLLTYEVVMYLQTWYNILTLESVQMLFLAPHYLHGEGQ